MLRIPFEFFEFDFERSESLSNYSNLISNGANPFRMVRFCIQMLRIPFEWLKFRFQSFEPFPIVRIWIQMVSI